MVGLAGKGQGSDGPRSTSNAPLRLTAFFEDETEEEEEEEDTAAVVDVPPMEDDEADESDLSDEDRGAAANDAA